MSMLQWESENCGVRRRSLDAGYFLNSLTNMKHIKCAVYTDQFHLISQATTERPISY